MTFVTVFRRVPRPIKDIERVAPMLKFSERIDNEIVVDTDEPGRRLELLHDNVKKYGTVFNTVAPGTDLTGVLARAK
jgi:hypothetical protein